MKAPDGKMRLTDVADMQGIFRIIQSIPSPKAEPFKLWLVEVGKERIDEIIDPELTIDRVLETYLKKGYKREWINQRLQAIQVRKELTDAWDDAGIQKGIEYVILTDEITKAWSGMTTRRYKNLKGLKKENLRDNMTTLEINIRQSMDGKSRWADNIMIERWFRSFKYEEVYLTQYNNIKEARTAIGRYIHTYNFERCHSALDYKTPAECYYPALLLPYVA